VDATRPLPSLTRRADTNTTPITQHKRRPHVRAECLLAGVLATPPFVLYLRSFTDDPRLGSTRLHARRLGLYDSSEFGSTQSVRTEEEQLRLATTPFGRMVAVGCPGERLPEIGARRLYLNHDDWQDSVRRLMVEAGRTGLVLMGTGLSDSLGWEFGQAVRTVPPQRLVLVIALNPPQYEQFRRGVGRVFPRELPHWPPQPTVPRYRAMIRGAIYFDADWTPHFVHFDSPATPGNMQRVIESRFVYGLRPVYHRLMVKWPGLAWTPRRAAFTRRQIPFVSVLLAVGVLILIQVVRLLLSLPAYMLPLFGFMLLVTVGSTILKVRSAR